MNAREQESVVLEPGSDALPLLLQARCLRCGRRRRCLVQLDEPKDDIVARRLASLADTRCPCRPHILLHRVARQTCRPRDSALALSRLPTAHDFDDFHAMNLPKRHIDLLLADMVQNVSSGGSMLMAIWLKAGGDPLAQSSWRSEPQVDQYSWRCT